MKRNNSKYNGNDKQKFKEKGCSRGFAQRPGIEFHKTFSPVLEWDLFESLCPRQYGMKTKQLDIATAYLNRDLEESLYVHGTPTALRRSFGVFNKK